MTSLDFARLSDICRWLNALPVYMFSGELTAALLVFAYDQADLSELDHAVRMVLNYQASLEEPMQHDRFIEIVELVLTKQPPQELVAFSGRDVTH